MSINVYLRGDEVRNLPDFKTTKREQNSKHGPRQEWEEYSLPGIRLALEKGRWFTTLGELTDPVPDLIAGIVVEITYQAYFANTPREAGIYRHESAEAEVQPDKFGPGDIRLSVRMRGEKMEDLRDLYRKIRAGTIRPEESYEGKQSGLSRAELLAERELLMGELGKANRNFVGIFTNLKKLQWSLSSRWPLCSRKGVRNQIQVILDSEDACV